MNDEIPIGSPPAPPGRHAAPGGWYPDPTDARRERYWDGWQWSSDVRLAEGGRPSAPGQQPYQQPYQQQPDQTYGARPQGHQQPQWNPTAAPIPMTADGVPLAGWWHRAGAIILDGIMLGILQTIAVVPLLGDTIDNFTRYFDEVLAAAQSGAAEPPQPAVEDLMSYGTQAAVTAVSLLIAFAWYTLFVRFKGATPGKLITGLRVVPVDHGRHLGGLGWAPSMLRALIWVLPTAHTLVALLRVVDIVMAAASPKKQSLHDTVAKTQVVRSR